ncbi:unnamed protein product [Caenorhabditis nigoni]
MASLGFTYPECITPKAVKLNVTKSYVTKLPKLAKLNNIKSTSWNLDERQGDDYFLNSLGPILTGERDVSREDVRQLEEMRKYWPNHHRYPSFDWKSSNCYGITETEDRGEGFDWLWEMSRYEGDIYCDTESITEPKRLALISLCCTQTRSILLWRVHQMDGGRLASVKMDIER